MMRKIFPKVFWNLNTKKDNAPYCALYHPETHEIELFIGKIGGNFRLFWVLLHESFHWITSLIIPDNIWNEINNYYDVIDGLLW